jgi:predicted dehydrogenase
MHRIRFAVIGLNHGHIYSQVDALAAAGGQLASFFAAEEDLCTKFMARYPGARRARAPAEILEDPSIALVASAAINCQRAALGLAVMRHGKDFMVDKPGFTTLEQLAEARSVQAETGRIYSVDFCERFHHPATVRAGELVAAGAIGRVVQTIGLGPHRANVSSRPAWFFRKREYGGILADIASHQLDQFLWFTGSTRAEIVAAHWGNFRFPDYPEMEDFGDLTVRGDGGTGYARVDWLTPDGLDTWGDGRLTILGTEGFIEIRKNCDLAGRPGGNHLFLVDHAGTSYFDCAGHPCPYAAQLIDDILNRTETAMPQQHCFLASQLALEAQRQARTVSGRGMQGGT